MSQLRTHWISNNGGRILIRQWVSHLPARGVIHVVHGMMEHSGMYHHWAMQLTKLGWDVVAHDQPGSGFSISQHWVLDHLPMDGDEHLINTALVVSDWISRHYKGVPMVRYGHSMGTFVVLNMQDTDAQAKGLILSAPMHESVLMLQLKQVLIGFLAKILGMKQPAMLAHRMTFFGLNRHFKPNESPVDWISRMVDIRNDYMDDPMCGNIASWGYFYSLVHCFKRAARCRGPWPRVLVLVGEHDPLSKGGKTLQARIKQMKHHAQQLQWVIVPGARHKIEGDGDLGIRKIQAFLAPIHAS